MREILRMAGATLVAAALLALATPAIASAGQVRPDTGTASGPFVALGDSYAAGNLIPDSPAGTPAGCLRSSHDYGADAAAALGVTSYVDATCNGATTASMTHSDAREPWVVLGWVARSSSAGICRARSGIHTNQHTAAVRPKPYNLPFTYPPESIARLATVELKA